jgi:nucleoside-diphosphate-sugar epimerase
MGELLVNDYSRKGFVDGRVVRLPTISVRPGRPNQATSSFVSSIIREPLHVHSAICPVSPALPLTLSSPATVIQNLLHATTLEAAAWGEWLTINLPGFTVPVQQLLDALERMSGAATLARVRCEPNESINRIVSSWPGAIDNTRALQLGFQVDPDFDDYLAQYLHHELPTAT